MLLRPSLERELLGSLPVWQNLQARMGGSGCLSLLEGGDQSKEVQEANLIITSDSEFYKEIE